MQHTSRDARRRVAALITTVTLLVGTGTVARGAAKKGELVEVTMDGSIGARQRGSVRGDEFGSDLGADVLPSTFGGGCLVGGPGARRSVGRIAAYDCLGNARIVGNFLFSIDGDEIAGGPVERFGEALMDIGHVDGADAVHWAIGAPGTAASGSPPAAVVILHERGGALVERLRLEGTRDSRLGWKLAPLEIEEGTSFFGSFAASAPGQRRGSRAAAGAVHRFDSRTGERFWTVVGSKRRQYLGYVLRTIPDLNDDGFPDLLVGAPGSMDGKTRGRVVFLSGADGRVLGRIKRPRGAVLFGFSAATGDINGDGVRDVLVGAPLADSDAGKDTGAVFAYSGVDLSLLRRWDGEVEGEWLGMGVAAVIDRRDGSLLGVAASSLFLDGDRPRRNRRGGLTIFSPASNDVLARKLGKRANDRLGWPILGCGGDGCLVGVPKSAEFFAPD
ncbi:MAG: integrin alpha [Thermoanaerobaculia bacterium]